jgi:hypothetical protein
MKVNELAYGALKLLCADATLQTASQMLPEPVRAAR